MQRLPNRWLSVGQKIRAIAAHARHPDDAHDAVLRINVSTQLEKSLFKVYVNGRLRTSYQVSATLSVETADRVLDVTKYPKGLHISEATELLQVSGSH